MKKKNIGAMITVIAAVTAGASAYATTLDNLDQDQNTNSLINEANYTDTYSDYDLVKYEYSKEVENTKIAKTSKTIEEEKQAEEAILDKKIEDAAREVIIEASKLEDKVSEEESEDNIEQVEVAKDDLSQEPVEEKAPIKQVEEPIENTQETEEEEKEEVLPVVKYVNTPLLNVRSSKDLEENNIIASLEAGDKIVGYQEDGFLVTEDGYVSEDFLSEAYPEDLLEDLSAAEEEAKAEEEARAAEEAKRAEEEARAAEEAKRAEEEARAAEEAKRAEEEARAAEEAKRAEEEARAAEEAKRAEEEARAAEEAKRAEEEAKDQASYYYSGWVNTSILNIRDGADGNIIGSARKGAWLEGNASGDWLEIDYNGGKGYVSLAYISDTEVEGEPVVEQAPVVDEVPVVDQVVEEAPSYQASGMDVVNIASQFQGYPYVWGASSPSVGFDCSGLTSYAYGQLGISIPHHSASQYASGYAVNYNNLMPGDLVFFSYGGAGIDHVGIVTSSDGTFIHASTPATGVRYDNVYNGSFANHYVGARRIF